MLIKTLEAQVRLFLLGCKCSASRGNVLQEQDFFGEFPPAFFLQKYPSIARAEMSNTPR